VELPFNHPFVRDLAWVMASPSLLADSIQVVSNDACQEIYNNNIDWLVKLDEQPELLLAALEQQKSHRLGYYFEHLVAFWLQQRIADENFASHVRVYEEKRTLGEFDFLFKTKRSDSLIHWETAVKFYLHYQAEDGKVWWYGPNAQDRLDIKLDRVFNHQLKLSASPQGRALLQEKGFENVQSQTFFKGYLFYPVSSDWRHPQPLPDNIAPHHLTGWWTRINTLELPDHEESDRWVVLPRLEWLAPRRIRQEQDSNLMDTQQLIDFLRKHFDHGQQSLLLTHMVWSDHSNWCEKTRGFVVSSAWPNQ
jgi:hypothetical protein